MRGNIVKVTTTIIFLFPTVLTQASDLNKVGIKYPELRQELLSMSALDQKYRKPGAQFNGKDALSVDSDNLQRLKKIIEKYSWPTVSAVGDDGAHAAWLIAQHADTDREFQREVLRQMEDLLSSGEVHIKEYAYLYDRVNTPQRYGTQGRCIARDHWEPLPIAEPNNVDVLRQQAGLPPLSQYVEIMNNLCQQHARSASGENQKGSL